jgi:hypothetical protein
MTIVRILVLLLASAIIFYLFTHREELRPNPDELRDDPMFVP